MREHNVTAIILRATDGIAETITDMVLYYTFFLLQTPGAKSSYDINRIVENAHSIVQTDINYKSIRRAFYRLKQRNLISGSMDSKQLLRITNFGMQRIAEIVPSYRTSRPWDGYIYLISYDISVKHNRNRNLLRLYLTRMGCALLQQSLWITPYNPKKIVLDFIKEKQLKGTILVSKLGKDGSIGDENLKDILSSTYHLDTLKKRYDDFLDACSDSMTPDQILTSCFSYLSVLKDDPQLPFPLEPRNLHAREAYHTYMKLMRTTRKTRAV